MRSIIIFVLMALILVSALTAKAIRKLDFQTVDMLTYRCFNEQKWDSVIVVGKQALNQDIDYYYLRTRLGIAYFEKKEYIPSITHLKKARQFNSGDPIIGDYLYRAYTYTNHPEEARILKSSMPEEFRKNEESKSGFLEQVHVESGFTLSSDRAPENLATLMGNDSIYGEQDLYGNSIYENFGLKFRVSNRIGISLAYNYLNFSKTKYIQYGQNYFYSFQWKIHDTSFSYHISQHEAYIAASVALPWGLKVMPAFHWINVSYTMINTAYRTDSISYSFTEKDTSFNNFVAALRISKDLGRFNIALSGSWSNLNGKTQKQAGISLTYYPLGNLNFYGTTTVTGFLQKNDKRVLLSQVLGAKITPWMWGEANFFYGDHTNANIFNGLIVYNNSDKIDYRAGASLFFMIGKHIQLSLIYQYFRKESQQIYYIKTQDPVTHEINEIQKIKNNPYNTNSIIGGITWKL